MSKWRKISSDFYVKLHDNEFYPLPINDAPFDSDHQSYGNDIQTQWNCHIALMRTQVSLNQEFRDVTLHKLVSENTYDPPLDPHVEDHVTPADTCKEKRTAQKQRLPLYARTVLVRKLIRLTRLEGSTSFTTATDTIAVTTSNRAVQNKTSVSPNLSAIRYSKDPGGYLQSHLDKSTSSVRYGTITADCTKTYTIEISDTVATSSYAEFDGIPDFLLPGSYARKDFKFTLMHWVTSHVDDSCRNDDGPLALRWDGKYGYSVKVVDSEEQSLLAIPFLAIKQIKYHLAQQKFFFEYDQSSDRRQVIVQFKTDNLVELQSFKHCGYTICKDRCGCSCDAASVEDFEELTTLITTMALKRAKPMASTREEETRPLPDPFARWRKQISLGRDLSGLTTRGGLTNLDSKQHGQKLVPVQNWAGRAASPIPADSAPRKAIAAISILSTSATSVPATIPTLVTAPSLESPPVPSSTAVSLLVPASVPILRTRPAARPSAGLLTETASAPLFVPIPASNWLKKRVSNPTADVSKRRKVNGPRGHLHDNPPGLFYDMCSLVRKEVATGDLVVRLRTQKATALEGKRDRFDVFDGPWEIAAIEPAQKSHLFSYSGDQKDFRQDLFVDSNDWLTLTSSKEQELAFRRMLTTKVRLEFPQGCSVSNTWSAIEHLLPCLDPYTTKLSFVHPNSLTVASLQSFQNLTLHIDSNDGIADKSQLHNEKLSYEAVESDERLYVVEINEKVHVAVIELSPEAEGDEPMYEVEKLRNKRLRLCPIEDGGLSDTEDPWIERIRRQYPDLLTGRDLCAEYLVHWCGWPNEDDTWEVARGNIPRDFIDEFHRTSDVFRDLAPEESVLPEQVIWQADLDALEGGWGQSMFVTD